MIGGVTAEEVEWLEAVLKLRRARSDVLFSRRRQIDDLVRPKTDMGSIIAYPDAFYHLTVRDVQNAIEQS